MASKKRPTAAKKPKAAEFRFEIDAFTPETMPMARLAEYMAELAMILGEPKSVHLVRLEPGSTVLVHRIEREAVPKVRSRTTAIRRGDAPRDAISAYKTVNKFLREDNGTAVLQDRRRGGIVVSFPGRDETAETYPSVRQYASIEGDLVRVGGTHETIPVILESEHQSIAGIHTSRAIARELGKHLFEPVRLNGQGTWSRDPEGVWSLRSFRVDSFEVLESQPLSTVLEELRAVPTDWGPDALDELDVIRHGRKRNGRS